MKIRTKRNPDGTCTQTLLDGTCIRMKSNGEARHMIVRRTMEYLDRQEIDPSMIWSFARAYDKLDDSSR